MADQDTDRQGVAFSGGIIYNYHMVMCKDGCKWWWLVDWYEKFINNFISHKIFSVIFKCLFILTLDKWQYSNDNTDMYDSRAHAFHYSRMYQIYKSDWQAEYNALKNVSRVCEMNPISHELSKIPDISYFKKDWTYVCISSSTLYQSIQTDMQ